MTVSLRQASTPKLLALLPTVLLLSLAAACFGGDSASVNQSTVLDTVYSFGQVGPASSQGQSPLPVTPGKVTTRWYVHEGWYVAVFEGLDRATLPPSCIGSSVYNLGTGQVEYPSNAPTAAGGCSGAAAAGMKLAAATSGVRSCGGDLAFITEIPADVTGTLSVAITSFFGDGAGVAVSGKLAVSARTLPSIDRRLIDCGPLPRPHVLIPPTPTEAATVVPTAAANSAGSGDSAAAPPPTPQQARVCAPVTAGALNDVTASDAGPYLLFEPQSAGRGTRAVIFLSGGSGSRGSAESSWRKFFGSGAGFEDFRVVLPYASGSDYLDESRRTFAIWHEVLSCFGGDPTAVHLGGASNGGLAAFALMLERPEYFATLLGAPGAFPVQDPTSIDSEVWKEKLAGRVVFNGVGAFDSDWKSEVIATHNSLVVAGVSSMFVEFPGQPHIITEAFDERVFLDFWQSH